MSMQTDGEINIKFGEERVVFTLLVHLQWKTLVKVDLCAIHEDFCWISKTYSISFQSWPILDTDPKAKNYKTDQTNWQVKSLSP